MSFEISEHKVPDAAGLERARGLEVFKFEIDVAINGVSLI